MNYKVIFEWVQRSVHAAQGASPSGMTGYNVWIEYTDNEFVDFLGFITEDQLYDEVEYYTSIGVATKVRGK